MIKISADVLNILTEMQRLKYAIEEQDKITEFYFDMGYDCENSSMVNEMCDSLHEMNREYRRLSDELYKSL